MALPEGLTLVDDAVERPFLTLRNLYITFSKLSIELLEYAAYIHMFIDMEKKIAVFQACEEDRAAIPFFKKPEKGKQILVRITGKKNASRLMQMAGIDDCGKGLRIYGDFMPEDKAIIFDLSIVGNQE